MDLPCVAKGWLGNNIRYLKAAVSTKAGFRFYWHIAAWTVHITHLQIIESSLILITLSIYEICKCAYAFVHISPSVNKREHNYFLVVSLGVPFVILSETKDLGAQRVR